MLVGHRVVARQARAVVEQVPNRNAFVWQFGDVFPHVVVIIQFALGLQKHDGLGGEHFRIGGKLESIIDAKRILVPFAEVAPAVGLFVYDLPLFGIQHYAVQAVAKHAVENLVGHPCALGHLYLA